MIQDQSSHSSSKLDESTQVNDSSVTLMNDPSDLGSQILIQITPKKRSLGCVFSKLCFSELSQKVLREEGVGLEQRRSGSSVFESLLRGRSFNFQLVTVGGREGPFYFITIIEVFNHWN